MDNISNGHCNFMDASGPLSVCRGGSRTAGTTKMELFVIIVNGFQPLIIITNSSTLDAAAVLGPSLNIICNLGNPQKLNLQRDLKYTLSPTSSGESSNIAFKSPEQLWGLSAAKKCSHARIITHESFSMYKSIGKDKIDSTSPCFY